MAYNYDYINPANGLPYAIVPKTVNGVSGALHVYQSGNAPFVPGPYGTQQGSHDISQGQWQARQQAAAAAEAASVQQPHYVTTTVQASSNPIAQQDAAAGIAYGTRNPDAQAAAAAGVSYDTYEAEKNAIKPLNTDAANGIPAGSTGSVRNPDAQAAAAAGISYDTYEAEKNAIKPLNTNAAQGIPNDTAAQQAQAAQTVAQDRSLDQDGSAHVASVPSPVSHLTGGMYIVQPNDNMWDLENKNGWAHGTLEDLNPGVDPHHLAIGSPLKVPGGLATEGPTDMTAPPAVVSSVAQTSSVGPSSSVYESSDSKLRTAAANLKARFTGGWGNSQGTDSPDPLRTVVEAVEHPPKTNPNPLDNSGNTHST